MKWPDSWLGRFFSPPPTPFAVGSLEFELLAAIKTAVEDYVILTDNIYTLLATSAG